MVLSEQHEMIRDALRALRKNAWRPMPHAGTGSIISRKNCTGLAALGAYGVAVPEELGGAGLDYLSLALVLEKLQPATAAPRP